MLTFVWGIPLVHALIRVWGNMTLMIDNLRITLPALMILLKYIIMQRKQSVILSIINMIREDWMSLNLIDAERNVMIKRSRTARLFVIYLNVLFILTLIVVSMLPWFGLSFRHVTNLTDQNRPLLLQTYYLYDTDKSPQFELTYLSQFISLLLAMIIYMSIDTFFVFVIFHVCGQLENFRRRLINLIPGKDFDKVLNNNVITHLKLIRYVNNIKNIFTLMILGSIMYFAIVFCLAGFVLLVEINTNEKINAENFLQICYMMVEIITLLLQMFFYCYAGELIIEQVSNNFTRFILKYNIHYLRSIEVLYTLCNNKKIIFYKNLSIKIFALPIRFVRLYASATYMARAKLITYFNNIEDIFTLMMFFSIIYFAVAFCLAGFMLLIVSFGNINYILTVLNGGKINVENVSELYYMIIVVIAFFVEMLFYCYVGELLTEQCETIYRTVYDLEWYKWDSRQARNLIILLVRIQEPFRITAGKIVPLTMTTFCSLVKTSAGYISFLLTMQH
ncbi:Odorant receptor 279 [Nylanderia fulva]|uniref:Odorant receptor 279 n=1 Tax=Nylanderia fulva TaxID=613905 RepID=A0A6G1LPZ8_9HYME|nr:Odorant receptor 279 [Nylanderia fulva]